MHQNGADCLQPLKKNVGFCPQQDKHLLRPRGTHDRRQLFHFSGAHRNGTERIWGSPKVPVLSQMTNQAQNSLIILHECTVLGAPGTPFLPSDSDLHPKLTTNYFNSLICSSSR